MRKKFASPIYIFLLRKAGFYVLCFFIATFLIWAIPRLMPGDPVQMFVSQIYSSIGGGGQVTEKTKLLYEYYVKKFNLDKPYYIQYLTYLQSIVTFDFSTSIAFYPTKVIDLVKMALPWSLALLIPAQIVGWIVGNYLGALAAYSRREKVNNVALYIFLLISQTPYYWLALMLAYIFAFQFHIFPFGGGYSWGVTPSLTLSFILDVIWHYVLPFLSLVLVIIGGQAIGMREMVIYELGSEYIHYGKSLGVRDSKLTKWAFRNAILPQVTGLALSIGNAVGGQVVTEAVFGYPGIGTLIYTGVLREDYPLIQGSFTILLITTLIANFIIDVLYAYIDPRIRRAYLGE
jgi:peptide/nickel transport system permease protein